MSHARRLRNVACVTTLLLVAAASTEAKAKKEERAKLLTRSIYLPVEFELCEHLKSAVLYQEEQALGVLPAKRIFQFTYYPTLNRIEPLKTDLRVEGVRDNGESFIGRLAVTPWGVFTANDKIELDMDEQLAKMRFKIDVRYDTMTLKMRCSDTCNKGEAVTTAEAFGTSTKH